MIELFQRDTFFMATEAVPGSDHWAAAWLSIGHQAGGTILRARDGRLTSVSSSQLPVTEQLDMSRVVRMWRHHEIDDQQASDLLLDLFVKHADNWRDEAENLRKRGGTRPSDRGNLVWLWFEGRMTPPREDLVLPVIDKPSWADIEPQSIESHVFEAFLDGCDRDAIEFMRLNGLQLVEAYNTVIGASAVHAPDESRALRLRQALTLWPILGVAISERPEVIDRLLDGEEPAEVMRHWLGEMARLRLSDQGRDNRALDFISSSDAAKINACPELLWLYAPQDYFESRLVDLEYIALGSFAAVNIQRSDDMSHFDRLNDIGRQMAAA